MYHFAGAVPFGRPSRPLGAPSIDSAHTRRPLGGAAVLQRPADMLQQDRHVERLRDVFEHAQSTEEVRATLQAAVLAGALAYGGHVQLLHLPTNQRAVSTGESQSRSQGRQTMTNQRRKSAGCDQSAAIQPDTANQRQPAAGHDQSTASANARTANQELQLLKVWTPLTKPEAGTASEETTCSHGHTPVCT